MDASVDISLVGLIGTGSLYAGGVTAAIGFRPLGVAKAALGGAGTAVGVAASFALMLVGARIGLPLMFTLCALFAAVIVYLTLYRDLDRSRAVVTAAGLAALITTAMLFVSYLAPLALVGACGVYLLLRLRLRTRPALMVMGGTLGGLLSASVAVFLIAIATM
jgi:hypothetical protein